MSISFGDLQEGTITRGRSPKVPPAHVLDAFTRSADAHAAGQPSVFNLHGLTEDDVKVLTHAKGYVSRQRNMLVHLRYFDGEDGTDAKLSAEYRPEQTESKPAPKSKSKK